MKTIHWFFSTVTVGLLVTACEKVIDVPLEEADRKIVVEAVFRDNPGDNYVLLSKTGSVYDNSDFEKISGAAVKITDQAGTEFLLTEVPGMPGAYSHASFQVMTNNAYTLSVVAGSETFTASSPTFYKPQFDSLTYTEQVGSFGVGTDTTYLVFFSFMDDGSAENFYRINAWVNGAADENLYVTNDELFNGQNYSQPIYATTVEKGDTVLLELLSMDKANYTYFYSLASNQAEGPFAATPSNPVSNITGGAIGYFGAYTTDTMTIIIPE
ncbi:MAG: DUF4249 domain-containing protein [Bacteroidetes bacterium]|nr:DUF4249 domain-containing protein [Bacteroidota bacterium]